MANLIHADYLYDAGTTVGTTNPVAWIDIAMTGGSTYVSQPIKVNFSNGYSSLFIHNTGTSDSVFIDFEVSLNGVDFYTPQDSSGTDLEKVITDGVCIQGDWWIVMAPQVANYIRFKFAPTTNSTVTAKYIQQERA